MIWRVNKMKTKDEIIVDLKLEIDEIEENVHEIEECVGYAKSRMGFIKDNLTVLRASLEDLENLGEGASE